MPTSTTPTLRADSPSYHALTSSPAASRPSLEEGLVDDFGDLYETTATSLGAAARWTSGAVGLGMVAAAASYSGAGGPRGEQAAAVGGAVAGAALYFGAIHDVLLAAHHPTRPAGGAARLARDSGLAVLGLAVGCAMSGSSAPTLGPIGSLVGICSGLFATNILNVQLALRESQWRRSAPHAAHGNRFLVGGATLLFLSAASLAWAAAVVGTAATGGSVPAVTGRLVGAAVTGNAGLLALWHLCFPGRGLVAEPDPPLADEAV